MKLIFSLLLLLVTTKECDNKKVLNDTKKSEVTNIQNSQMQQKDYILEYSAITRGTFKEIIINSSSISIKKDRNSKPVTKECPNKIWSNITKTLDEVDLSKLADLKAPTQKRTYDAAAHALLKVTVHGETYTSASFDHGFPPEEIKVLCDKLTEFLE